MTSSCVLSRTVFVTACTPVQLSGHLRCIRQRRIHEHSKTVTGNQCTRTDGRSHTPGIALTPVPVAREIADGDHISAFDLGALATLPPRSRRCGRLPIQGACRQPGGPQQRPPGSSQKICAGEVIRYGFVCVRSAFLIHGMPRLMAGRPGLSGADRLGQPMCLSRSCRSASAIGLVPRTTLTFAFN